MKMKMTRRKFLWTFGAGVATTPFMVAGGLSYALDVEPDWVEVNPLTLTLPRLHRAFAGYRLLQISDLHLDVGKTADRLPRIQALINAEAPDLIVITGDFITNEYGLSYYRKNLVDFLSGLQAKDGVAAILGNHDHWTNPDGVHQLLAEVGIWDMTNRVRTLERGAGTLHLCGLDDYWSGKPDMDAVLKALPATDAAILLMHEPDYADISSATGRFDLQLSGHSHGGQVRLPLINRPIQVPYLAQKYPVGQYQVGTMIQYTNRGIGTIYPAVRFNCRPEITVFTLNGKENA